MKEFAVFDDQESQNSEFDREFLSQHFRHQVEVKEEEISSIDMLNPFRMRTNSRDEVPKGRRSMRNFSRQARSRGREERGSVDKRKSRRSKSSFDGVKKAVPLKLGGRTRRSKSSYDGVNETGPVRLERKSYDEEVQPLER